ncbi:hypothetical protein [Aureivirga marina]|uniref:hypothetical protein n=1 Tax=Aureivirga marina TaxID=1182451 RepID=UPI0018C9DEF9|nr:hypothetical protein [Aureivirga marina]
MKLTEKEIENLFEFTEKHYVEYYDLQLELVDHMANDIEQILEENPKLTFDEAREKAFKKFGVLGFSEIVEQRRKFMFKEYFKIASKVFFNHFKFPKIFQSLFLLSCLFLTFQNISFSIIFRAFAIIYFVYAIYTILQIFKYNRFKKKGKKKLLFQEIIFRLKFFETGVLGTIPMVQIFLDSEGLAKLNHTSSNIYLTIGFTVFTFLFVLIKYILSFEIPKKEDEILKKKYPYYRLIK